MRHLLPRHRLVLCLLLLLVVSCGSPQQIETTPEEPVTTTFDIDASERRTARLAAQLWHATVYLQAVQHLNATIAENEAAERAEREAREAAAVEQAPAAASPQPPAPTSWFPPDSPIPEHLRAFFSCVKAHESGGNYAAVNPSGKYRGAYQMDVNFWRSHAPADWQHLAGSHETAPPAVQDAAAFDGYQKRGNRPWNGICGAYG